MIDDILWQTKLHARLHDPAEKALVLLRDPEGHEGGTSRALHEVLFASEIPDGVRRDVQRADWWAAAADRPQWPKEVWARVPWAKQPILVHPLTGQSLDLKSLADTDIEEIKQRSFDHFSRLTVKEGENVDWKRTLLAYWRFGPELAAAEDDGGLGMLWPLLPADTRVPDHSIWDHLDLTSAFAGAFAADPSGHAALLVMSVGPVQSFIAAARSTSDLWAGSHLLSRLSWEAMKVICEHLGPDAILFPRLRAVPQVDLWLRDEMHLAPEWFEKADWQRRATDANPLFAAALPNRFVAIVPASQVNEIAEDVTNRVREWLQRLGKMVVDRLLKAAGEPDDGKVYAYNQMRRQLDGFPEVHWASAEFSLIRPRNTETQTNLDVSALTDVMAPFYGVRRGEACGFLASPAWRVLGKEIPWGDNTAFFDPNPGVLYPAIYELVERVLAAAKSAHPFDQLAQAGWRDSLTGENEWLSSSDDALAMPPGRRNDTLWASVAAKEKSWAKVGEHLGALSAIKRLWPVLFAEEVRDALAMESVRRFVVSTHTMALAHQLDRWLESDTPLPKELITELKNAEPVALPRRLTRHSNLSELLDYAKRIPALIEQAREDAGEGQSRRIEALIRTALTANQKTNDKGRLETYYALLMLDGDDMGAWLSGGNEKNTASYRDCFHPAVRYGFDRVAAHQPLLRQYGEQPRTVSPNRHIAISAALNDFALHAAPEIVENEHLGRLIYAGGDDVLAMLPVADLLPAMQRLRWAYSGHDPSSDQLDWRQALSSKKLEFRNGFGFVRGRLLRLMGEKATASCGAVIAHYQAPLAAVLRELRAAEQRAKNDGGKNAWSLALIKRSGGTIYLTAKWGEPVAALEALHRFFADPDVSRRAVYNALDWLKDLPPHDPDLLGALLGYQFKRQAASEGARVLASELAPRLVKIAFDANQRRKSINQLRWLETFLIAGEFLAREVRADAAAEAEPELAQ
ncbi:MAG TPA: type III-B CRISPR-associated protein Cas10/Cmr2 [Xanthobacteraceae bacterium]